MRSGGDLIVSPVHGTHTVDINHAARDVREQLRGVETPEGLLRDEQRLPDHDRGFGQAPKTVQIEGSVTTGFKMVFRRWAPGCDPASLPLAEMPKSIVSSSKILDFPAPPGKSGPKDGAR